MEAIGNLAGGMAHDFNNLLAVIIGNLDLLRHRRQSDPVVEQFAGQAILAATRRADLTRRMLAFARQQPMRPSLVDVNACITDTVVLCGAFSAKTSRSGSLWVMTSGR